MHAPAMESRWRWYKLPQCRQRQMVGLQALRPTGVSVSTDALYLCQPQCAALALPLLLLPPLRCCRRRPTQRWGGCCWWRWSLLGRGRSTVGTLPRCRSRASCCCSRSRTCMAEPVAGGCRPSGRTRVRQGAQRCGQVQQAHTKPCTASPSQHSEPGRTERAPLPFLRAISAAVLPSQSAVSSAAAPPASTRERSRAGEPLRAAACRQEVGAVSA